MPKLTLVHPQVPICMRAKAQNDCIDHHMDNPVPEAQAADRAQVLEESAWEQDQPARHHVGPGVHRAPVEGAHHEVPAQHHVEDASHE